MRALDIGQEDYKKLSRTLGQLDFFSNLSLDQLDQVLKLVRLNELEPGEFVYRQGDPGDALYLVFQGVLSVKSRRFFFLPRRIIGLLQPGMVFGEMALLDRNPRASTVQALVRCQVFSLAASNFDDIMEADLAFAKKIRRVASQRLVDQRHAA